MRVGARASPLSRVQAEEVLQEIRAFHPEVDFELVWVETSGDKDKTTSLRALGKSDFFTKELDEMLLEGKIDVAVHSAKDLPEPMPKGLAVAAITKGVDPRDCLVYREPLLPGMVVATSSERREEAVKAIVPGIRVVDLRGTIGERLGKVESGEVDGVVLAEAALIRLGLTGWKRIFLPGETAPMQGRLAVVVRKEDAHLRSLFRPIDFGMREES